MSVFRELKRRNVFRMAALYVVASWLVIQVAGELIGLAHLPDWIGPTIIWLLAIGFPISLIFSWFYEITPQGISLEKDVAPEKSITHVTGRRLDFIVISMLLAAVILFAYDKWWIGGPLDKSIAVLPFINMSGDPGQEYFSDGISEDLLNVLAKIPGLRVVARTSSFQFKGENRDIIDIGQQLNVAHILEGSVRKAGSQLRITAQLIDASNGFHLWSETYDRELENIFAVQDEISAAIVGALKEQLGLEVEKTPRVITAANTEAHDAYLRGRYLVVQRTRATVEGAVREFEKAIALDTEYALAHAELSMAILLLRQYGDLTITEAIARAAPHAERAMAIDSTLAEAHAATGFILDYQHNFAEALTYYRQAIQINPNYSVIYQWMGIVLDLNVGRYAEGFVAVETASRLDPLSIPNKMTYIRGLIDRNQLAESDLELENLASISPDIYPNMSGIRASLGGKWANAVLGNLEALQIDPKSRRWRGRLQNQFAIIGLDKEALAIIKPPFPFAMRMLGRPKDAITTAEARLTDGSIAFTMRRGLGQAFASAGDYARARPILEKIWQRSDGRIARLGLFRNENAAALIAIRRDAGEEADAKEILAALRDDVQRYREAGISRTNLRFHHSVDYEEGLTAFLAGERERGLVLISKGAEDGFFIPLKEAYLQTLYDDPGFAPIRASQEARQKRERDRLLDIVCTDNPYAAVWQPEEGTCERFATIVGN